MWYALTLCTSNMPAAGTDADVFVTIHGKQGSSPRIKLPSRPEDFVRGGEDTFRMELHALGEIVKLTIGHNNMGHNPGWHLDHAELVDEETGRTCLLVQYCSHNWTSMTVCGCVWRGIDLLAASACMSFWHTRHPTLCSACSKLLHHADAVACSAGSALLALHQTKVQLLVCERSMPWTCSALVVRLATVPCRFWLL